MCRWATYQCVIIMTNNDLNTHFVLEIHWLRLWCVDVYMNLYIYLSGTKTIRISLFTIYKWNNNNIVVIVTGHWYAIIDFVNTDLWTQIVWIYISLWVLNTYIFQRKKHWEVIKYSLEWILIQFIAIEIPWSAKIEIEKFMNIFFYQNNELSSFLIINVN